MSNQIRSGQKIKMQTIDELLGASTGETSEEIEISKIQGFENHPFKVLDDDKMAELVESIRLNGVLSPVLVRSTDEGGYEMISGHRRMHAAKLAGLVTIPAFVRDMTDDEATIAMVDANIQREEMIMPRSLKREVPELPKWEVLKLSQIMSQLTKKKLWKRRKTVNALKKCMKVPENPLKKCIRRLKSPVLSTELPKREIPELSIWEVQELSKWEAQELPKRKFKNCP